MLVPLLSALAIAALVALAWWLGFRDDPVLDEAAAIAEAEGRLAGFRASAVALAADGRGAILRGRDGSFGLLLPLGDGWIARRLPPGTRLVMEGPVLRLRLDEPVLREARLRLAASPGWPELRPA
ncbi:hypothetical protein ACUJ46_00930 [Sandaracinobacteroides sp. A072]|uniref:hypothetical protein n=1 Tax=Sandaracinobacteroides sp. A072 TaxID=3461146 RepID=UPI0040412E24